MTMNTNQQPTAPQNHPWEQYLPSKKIQKVLLVLFIVIIGYTLWKPIKNLVIKLRSNSTDTIVATTLPQPIIEQTKTPLSTDKDTDSDGLADWQETLIGTDPEIPNSQTEVPQSVRDLVTKNTADVITTEDKLALNIYQRLLSDPKGVNITEAIQAATSKEVLDLADSIDKQFTNYGYDDLDLIDDSASANQIYKNSIVTFNKTLKLDEQTAREIYNTLLTGQKTINITTFQIVVNQSIAKLLQIPVPLKMADMHLNLLNALVHINSILDGNQINSSENSLLYASFLVFQKNVNVATQTVDTIIQILNL